MISRSMPAYAPTARARAIGRSRPSHVVHLCRDWGLEIGDWIGSGSPQPSHTGRGINWTVVQQALHTALRSGVSSTTPQTAQAGDNNTDRTLLMHAGIRDSGLGIRSITPHHR